MMVVMNLATCPLGKTLTIDSVCDLAPEVAFRLEELRIRPGCEVCVLQRGGFGGRVISAGQQRFAVDAVTARALLCREAV